MIDRPTPNLPACVRVGAHLFSIQGVTGLKCSEGADAYGLCDHDSLRILIDLDQHASLMRDTLLHEIVHAIAFQCGLDDDSTEEQWATVMGSQLLSVLTQNPTVLAFLMKEVAE